MFTFLLIVQTLVAASLVAVILMQRSEGGGLGVGGSSSGFMTARGAADFLTRSTSILGGAVHRPVDRARRDRRRRRREPAKIDTSLANRTRRSPLRAAVAAGPAARRAAGHSAAPATKPHRRSRSRSKRKPFTFC